MKVPKKRLKAPYKSWGWNTWIFIFCISLWATTTGASSGIGEATEKILAEGGAKVVLAARREDRMKKLSIFIWLKF